MRLLQRCTSAGSGSTPGAHSLASTRCMWRSFMARAGPAPQGHDPGHAPGDPLRQRLGHVAHAGGQAAVGQVLRPGAPAACGAGSWSSVTTGEEDG